MKGKQQKHYKFYKSFFRIHIGIYIILLLFSVVTLIEKKEIVDPCDELGKETLWFYSNIVEPDIEYMKLMRKDANKSNEGFDIYLESIEKGLTNFNAYLNMSREYFLCLKEK